MKAMQESRWFVKLHLYACYVPGYTFTCIRKASTGVGIFHLEKTSPNSKTDSGRNVISKTETGGWGGDLEEQPLFTRMVKLIKKQEQKALSVFSSAEL